MKLIFENHKIKVFVDEFPEEQREGRDVVVIQLKYCPTTTVRISSVMTKMRIEPTDASMNVCHADGRLAYIVE